MKKFLLFSFLLISVAAFSQAPVEFKETKHSFGKLKQNVPATYIFSFTNTGAKPAIIETATAECGCTTPEYPKAPIAKGKTATIKVTYNAATPGQFTKKVNVKFANVPDVVVLTIDGEVVPATK
ncbi:MAG: DUF1573 domain-containing protein [Filimonas sp.]|nr:DUF1573 domain-containing protein [Filimonas sp.]